MKNKLSVKHIRHIISKVADRTNMEEGDVAIITLAMFEEIIDILLNWDKVSLSNFCSMRLIFFERQKKHVVRLKLNISQKLKHAKY